MYFTYRQEKDKMVLLELSTEFNKKSIEIKGELADEALTSLKNGYVVFLKDDKIEVGSIDKYYGFPLNEPNKVQVVKKAREYVNNRATLLDSIDFITYIDTNNKLSSKGFFVTEDNREEVYLQILETGDEDLVDLLEEFLIAKDNLGPLISAKKEYNDITEKLKKLDDDSEEVKELIS